MKMQLRVLNRMAKLHAFRLQHQQVRRTTTTGIRKGKTKYPPAQQPPRRVPIPATGLVIWEG